MYFLYNLRLSPAPISPCTVGFVGVDGLTFIREGQCWVPGWSWSSFSISVRGSALGQALPKLICFSRGSRGPWHNELNDGEEKSDPGSGETVDGVRSDWSDEDRENALGECWVALTVVFLRIEGCWKEESPDFINDLCYYILILWLVSTTLSFCTRFND
jgi:hypothetical protein